MPNSETSMFAGEFIFVMEGEFWGLLCAGKCAVCHWLVNYSLGPPPAKYPDTSEYKQEFLPGVGPLE